MRQSLSLLRMYHSVNEHSSSAKGQAPFTLTLIEGLVSTESREQTIIAGMSPAAIVSQSFQVFRFLVSQTFIPHTFTSTCTSARFSVSITPGTLGHVGWGGCCMIAPCAVQQTGYTVYYACNGDILPSSGNNSNIQIK